MTDTLLSLGEAVLPLIRSRSRDLWRYSAANEHGARMHEGVSLLEIAQENPAALAQYGVGEPSPRDVYQVTHKALSSAIRVIARADDSAGIIGDACRALIELHPCAAAGAEVSPTKLADWVYDFHFDEEVDYFNLDPVAYAPALGEKGMARLRTRVDALRAEIPVTDLQDRPRYDHRELLLEWFDQRFAVLDRDNDAIIRTHLRDGKVAAWHEDVAAAFEEIGNVDLALEWAERATLFDTGHQSRRAADRWQRLLGEHRTSELPQAVRTIFERWPTACTAAKLVETSVLDVTEEVQEKLQSVPAQLVRFQLDTMRDPRLAWQSAERLDLQNDGLWANLAQAYLPIDPVPAIRVQLRLVENLLVTANTRNYRPAVRDLVKIRKSAGVVGGTEAVTIVNTAVAALRERYKRRPSLMSALDRAGLP